MLKAEAEGITPQQLIRRIAAERPKYLEGFHIDNARGKSGRLDRCLALLDVLGASRNQQHVIRFPILLGGAQHLEVVADLVHREGNVLVRLHLHLRFEIRRTQPARHLDHFSDGSIAADRYRDFGAASAGALRGTPDRLANRLCIDDGLLVDCVLGSGLGSVGFHAILAARHGDLDELHRRCRYV